MTNCILINGPKGVGKDTAALAIKGDRSEIAIVSLMKVQKYRALDAAGLDPRLWFELFEQFKDKSFDELEGRTPREVYIAWSERRRAEDKLGIVTDWLEAGIEAERAGASTIIAPDVRFVDEWMSSLYRFQAQNVLLLRIYKAKPERWMDGLPFKDDVGSYFATSTAAWGHTEINLINDLSLEEYRHEACVIGNSFIARRRTASRR